MIGSKNMKKGVWVCVCGKWNFVRGIRISFNSAEDLMSTNVRETCFAGWANCADVKKRRKNDPL